MPLKYRKQLRLKDYDYTQVGVYFLTICIHQRACLLGDIIDETMVLNAAGHMIAQRWQDIPSQFPTTALDMWVVMPNHHHGIIVLNHDSSVSISKIVQWFKIVTTKNYIHRVKTDSWEPFSGRLWQINFYDHIVRKNDDLARVRDYIENNPQRWQIDTLKS